MRKSDQFNAALYIAVFGSCGAIGTYLLARESFVISLSFGLSYIGFWILFWLMLRAEVRWVSQPMPHRWSGELWRDPRFKELCHRFSDDA